MNAPLKDAVSRALALAASAAVGFGAVARLIREDAVLPGPGSSALLAAALAGAGCMILAASVRGSTLLRFPLILFVAVLVPALGFASVLLAPGRRPQGLPFLAAFAGAFLFLPVALQGGRDREFSKNLLKAAIGAVAIQAAVGVSQFLGEGSERGRAALQGTMDSSPHLAGLLVMALPAMAGLFVNSIHETLDPSVWPRRLLYGVTGLLFAAGLYDAGSETAWAALALGAVAFLGFTGWSYVRGKLRVLLPAAGVVLAVAGAAAVLQTQTGFRPPGYGRLETRRELVRASSRDDLAGIARSPSFGDGFARESLRARGEAGAEARGAAPSPLRLASAAGLPLLAAFLLLLALSFTALARGTRAAGPPEQEERVVVGRRRAVKAIEIASAVAAGGTAAFLLAGEGAPSLSRATFLVICLPLWLAFLAGTYSYKHFQMVGENRRDFVAIGAAAGVVAGLFRSLAGDDLLHPPSLFFVLLLLAVAVSRSLAPEEGQPLDFRSPKILRPAMGIVGLLLCAAGVWALARGL
jgi:hypothetical protein